MVFSVTCLRRCTACGLHLILVTMSMVAAETWTSLLVGIDVSFAIYSFLAVALLETMEWETRRAEVAVSGIAVTSFMTQDQFCRMYLACAFIILGSGRHAVSRNQCRFCSALVFYAACPAWPTKARLLMAAVGLLAPLFPPRSGAARSSGDPHPVAQAGARRGGEPRVSLPELDAEVLQEVRELQRYPKRRKTTSNDAEKQEKSEKKQID